ncbi:MAG: outer-membrane lipoprotein carrier protein LolA [Pyrinomonadaceae bacterium]|nr:outer-membrane lipoprotein carrier protein LolA [Pyrinomonadaceae bacterium]
MKRFTTLSLIAVLAVIATTVVFVPRTTHAQSAGIVSSILNRMDRNRRDLRTLRSGIMMEKCNTQIGDCDRFMGAMIYMPGKGRNSNVRIDWQKPQVEMLAVADGKYTLFRPRLNMAYQGSANSNRNRVSSVLGFGLNVTQQQLRTQFEPVQVVGDGTLDGGIHVVQLRLTPRGNAGYKYAEIWVDDSGMPVQTKWVERNDDYTTVRLFNVQKNAGISAGDFRLQLGGDVKIVRS